MVQNCKERLLEVSGGWDDSFLQKMSHEDTVVILRGYGEGESFQQWTPDELARRFPEREVSLAKSGTCEFGYDAFDASFTKVKTSLSNALSFINDSSGHSHYYLMQQSFRDVFPELLSELPIPSVLLQYDQLREINLWIGSALNITPLHWDLTNNFFLQIHGQKRFLLYSPDQSPFLYPNPVWVPRQHMSRVDPENPDFNRFPEFRNASPLEVVLGPGDAMLLPSFWWHHVTSLNPAVSANVWWAPLFRQCIAPCGLRAFAVCRHQLGPTDQFYDCREFEGLIGMASYLFQRGILWAAILFAESALEEHMGRLANARGLKAQKTDAQWLTTLCAELRADSSLWLPPARLLERLKRMGDSGEKASDAELRKNEVAAVIEQIRDVILHNG